jgi:hypothetical protein
VACKNGETYLDEWKKVIERKEQRENVEGRHKIRNHEK